MRPMSLMMPKGVGVSYSLICIIIGTRAKKHKILGLVIQWLLVRVSQKHKVEAIHKVGIYMMLHNKPVAQP